MSKPTARERQWPTHALSRYQRPTAVVQELADVIGQEIRGIDPDSATAGYYSRTEAGTRAHVGLVEGLLVENGHNPEVVAAAGHVALRLRLEEVLA